MIVGVGTDLCSIDRIAAALLQHGDRFRLRVLTVGERKALASRVRAGDAVGEARWFAKRYAAKEAVAKAFGTGIGASLSFQDIVIANDALGRPLVTLQGGGIVLAEKLGVQRLHLSLSDERDLAMAFVVLES